jgi:peroxiredoxin
MSRYRDNSGEFTATNTQILGISVDSDWANSAFAEKVGAGFPILSDFRKDVSRKYGVLNEQTGLARRVTFVVDRTGVIRHVDLDQAALDPATALGVCRILKEPGQK